MPGISCVFGSSVDRNSLQNAICDLTGDGYSSASELYSDNQCAVVFSGHPGYPYNTIETETYFAVLEGMIYNQSQPSIDTLIDSISVSFVGGAVPEKKVQAFLRDCSGEYIVSDLR